MNVDMNKMKQQFVDFTESLKSIMLSTVSEEGKPFVSYAPYVRNNGKFYIYLSTIANHYRYMEANPSVDVMLVEDESSTKNIFARQRARFACTAVNLGDEGHEDIFELFGQSFGKSSMGMLRGLDFSLFELTPTEGRYVAGFGLAFDIDLTTDRFEHVAREGHQPAQAAK